MKNSFTERMTDTFGFGDFKDAEADIEKSQVGQKNLSKPSLKIKEAKDKSGESEKTKK